MRFTALGRSKVLQPMLTMTNGGGGVVPSGPGPPGSCSAEAPGPIRGPTGQSWLAEHTWTLSVQ